MSSIGVFYSIRSSLFFWQQGNFIFVGKRYTNFTNIQRTSYFISMYFLKNIIFHFPSVEKYLEKKKCLISSWYRKDHTPVQFFWKDHLLRTFEEYIIFPCFFVFLLSFFFWEIFPDHTRHIIIFPKHLEKENMVFRAVLYVYSLTLYKSKLHYFIISKINPKFSCSNCPKNVAKNHNAVYCDICNLRVHLKCINIRKYYIEKYKMIRNCGIVKNV